MDRNALSVLVVALMMVALRKESVDRNTKSPLKDNTTDSRSPQGERG